MYNLIYKMKFGKEFESHLTLEWRQQYMQYSMLKEMIKQAVDNAPEQGPSQSHNSAAFKIYYEIFRGKFFTQCDNELFKVSNFYQEKLAESRRKHSMLRLQLLENTPPKRSETSNEVSKLKPKPKTKRYLRFALSEFYLSLILLQNYQTLNLMGFRKICKKYDKFLNTNDGQAWFRSKIEAGQFNKTGALNNMIVDIEDLYTQHLENGVRSSAMAKLRVPPLGEPSKPCEVFRAGFFFGIFVVLTIIVIIELFKYSQHSDDYSFIVLFRGPFIWVIFMFYMALNIAGFQYYGVNYILIFELDPRNHLKPINYLEYASLFGIMWSGCMLCFLWEDFFKVDGYIFPLILIVATFVILINPLPIMGFSSRYWLLRVMGRIFCAPFFYVNFADFWLADQMNSLVTCMADHYFIIKFDIVHWLAVCNHAICLDEDHYVVIARALPAWFRFAQSLRRYRDSGSKSVEYLLNAGKYSTMFFVIFFAHMMKITTGDYVNTFENPYIWGYLISSLVFGIYALAWDLLRDFGLFQVWSGKKIFLREQLIYPIAFYHFIVIQNILARFFWIVTFYWLYHKTLTRYQLSTCSSFLEITRRCLWNFLRLENEHLNNCGHFRATRDIFVSSLVMNDQSMLVNMMDNPDGVTNRDKDDSDKKKRGIDKEHF